MTMDKKTWKKPPSNRRLHGIYLLTIENSSISKIQIFDSGSFVYRNDSLLFTLEYINAEGYPATYNCSFSGVLIPWLKR